MNRVNRSRPYIYRSLQFLSIAGIATVSLPVYAEGESLPQDGLSFYAPFDGSLKASVGAKADPASLQGEPSFSTGRSGKALLTGAKDSFLLYSAEDAVRGDEGTVSMWVSPQWTPDNANFHMFWQLRGNGYFSLYRDNGGKQLIFLYRGKGLADTQYNQLASRIDDWKPNEWHHIAATWRAGEIRLYVDGQLKREVVDANMVLPAVDKGSIFFVGDPWHTGYGIQNGLSGTPDTSLDELRLYTRALNNDEIRSLAGKAEVPKVPLNLQMPRVVVPKTRQAPVIDGVFNFDEWKDATAFTGFVDLTTKSVAERQTTTVLTYDDTNLYVATFAPMPGGAQLRNTVDKRDGPVYGDDSVEMYLSPTRSGTVTGLFQFIGNSGGQFADYKNGNPEWDGNWKYKTSLQSNWRGFGQTYWVTELAIPFKDLGRATPVDGEKWDANFARTWYIPSQLFSSWAPTGTPSYGEPKRFGELEFSSTAPAFQWLSLRDFSAGQPTLEGSALGAPSLNLQVANSEQQLVKKDLPADGDKAKLWVQQVDLAGASYDAMKVESRAASGQVLYSAQVPYRLETKAVRVILGVAPSSDLLLVDADPLRFRKQWQEGGKMTVRLEDASGKVFSSQEIAGSSSLPARARLSLARVPAGDYQLNVVVLDRAGKVAATQATPFTKRRPPVWLNNKIGITDRVLKPWTPIVADARNLKMWGRDYRFDNNALPQQVSSLGKGLLQSPARLQIDGKPLVPGTSKLDLKTPSKVVRSGSAQSGAWKVNWKCTAEYDGMLWYEVTLVPGRGGASLQSLALELPMLNEASGLYHIANGPYGLTGGEAGGTPAKWTGAWKQSFWLGNEKAGLNWFNESDQHWNLKQPQQALVFTRDAKRTVARVNFVDSPMAVTKPITYRFGLMATPTRPMPKNWRSWQHSTGGRYVPNNPVRPTTAVSWWSEWSPYIASPFDANADAAEVVARYHKDGIKVIPYQALLSINEKAPDFDYYKTEWLSQPQMDGGGEAGQQMWFVNVKGSFQDYFLYGMRERMRKDKWDGMYFDFAQGPVPDTNELHGAGYVDEKGDRRPTYDILAEREFHKRLWAMLQEETGSDEPLVMIHNSEAILPAVNSFANIYYDGEQFLYSPKVYDDYTKVVSRERFRAEFLGSNFGGIPMFLPELGLINADWVNAKNETDKAAAHKILLRAMDSMLLMTLTHGTLFSPEQMDLGYIQPLLDAQVEFKLGEANFLGYWENQHLVSLSPDNPEVKASLYIRDNRFWLEVGNWTDQEQMVNAKLDLAKICPALKAATAVTKNIWKDGAVTRSGDSWKFSVPPKSARIIEIRNP